jgi:hypothetical protein
MHRYHDELPDQEERLTLPAGWGTVSLPRS